MSETSKASAPKDWHCVTCDCTFLNKNLYDQHCQGKKHKKNEAVLKEKHDAKCTLYAFGLRGVKNTEAFLGSYFYRYGKIEKIKTGFKPDFAFVKFENPQSVMNAVKRGYHTHQGYHFRVKEFQTRKPQPPDIQGKKKEMDHQLQSLINSLAEAHSMNHQCAMMSEILTLPKQDLVIRRELCGDLTNTFYPYFETCSVHQFGSSINGYGMKGCDLDLFLDFNVNSDFKRPDGRRKISFPFPFKPKGIKNLTTRNAPLNQDQVEAMSDLDKVKFVSHILRASGRPFVELLVIPSKRCPLVRFVHRPLGLKCDLSLNNRKALYNSRLLRIYSQDPRVQQLVIVIRYWARVQQLTCTEGTGHLFTSYALTWLVLYFLMQRKPRVIPLVDELPSLLVDQGVQEEIIDSCKCLSIPMTAELPPSQNTEETAADLLRGFFQFYATEVNWEKQALSTYDGQVIQRQLLEQNPAYAECKVGCMTILDPFVLTHNIVANVSDRAMARFESEVKKAAVITKSWSHSDTMPASASDKLAPWGLADILKPSPMEDSPQKTKKRKEKGKIEGEQDNGTFVVNLRPDLKVLSSPKFNSLCEKEKMSPSLFWCSLAQKMVVNILETVYFIDVNEQSVEEFCVSEGDRKSCHDDIDSDCDGSDEGKQEPISSGGEDEDKEMEFDDKTKPGDEEEGINENDMELPEAEKGKANVQEEELDSMHEKVELGEELKTDQKEEIRELQGSSQSLTLDPTLNVPSEPITTQEIQMSDNKDESESVRIDTSKRSAQKIDENSNKRFKLQSKSEEKNVTVEGNEKSENICDNDNDETASSLKLELDDKIQSNKDVKSNPVEQRSIDKQSNTQIIKTAHSISSCSNSTKAKSDVKADQDPVKETLEKAVGDLKSIFKIWSFSCLHKKSLWQYRMKVRPALVRDQNLDGLTLEREISKKVLEKLDQSTSDQSSDCKLKEKEKTASKSHQLSSSPDSPDSDCLKEKDEESSDQPSELDLSSDSNLTEKERKILEKLGQLRSSSHNASTTKERKLHMVPGNTSSKTNLGAQPDSAEKKSKNNAKRTNSNNVNRKQGNVQPSKVPQNSAKAEKPETSLTIPFSCKIVESRYVDTSHPRVIVIMHPESEQLNHFRNFFISAGVLITKLVSMHLLDGEF